MNHRSDRDSVKQLKQNHVILGDFLVVIAELHECESYMSSQCPADPRSLIHLDRWRWQTRRRESPGPSSAERGLSHRGSEWTDAQNTNTGWRKALVENVSQNKPNMSNTRSMLECLSLYWCKTSVFKMFRMPLLEFFSKASPKPFLWSSTINNCMNYYIRNVDIFDIWFSLTYCKLASPFLFQPMRYKATSEAPWSQLALKLLCVASVSRRFCGAGTTSTE